MTVMCKGDNEVAVTLGLWRAGGGRNFEPLLSARTERVGLTFANLESRQGKGDPELIQEFVIRKLRAFRLWMSEP